VVGDNSGFSLGEDPFVTCKYQDSLGGEGLRAWWTTHAMPLALRISILQAAVGRNWFLGCLSVLVILPMGENQT
jgi:hypothetical protein